MAKIIKKRFLKKELNAWLREHRSWGPQRVDRSA